LGLEGEVHCAFTMGFADKTAFKNARATFFFKVKWDKQKMSGGSEIYYRGLHEDWGLWALPLPLISSHTLLLEVCVGEVRVCH